MDDVLHPLLPGTTAPDFRLRHTLWSTLSLHRLAGQPTILVFFPTAFEPVSREQLVLYQEYLPQFEKLQGQVLVFMRENGLYILSGVGALFVIGAGGYVLFKHIRTPRRTAVEIAEEAEVESEADGRAADKT